MGKQVALDSYWPGAEAAWAVYNRTGDVEHVGRIIAACLHVMKPPLLRQLFIMALVFTKR